MAHENVADLVRDPTEPLTTEPKKTRRKTDWGCLLLIIIPVLMFAGARAYDVWREKQPLHYHLRKTFKESGFTVPGYVTKIDGSKGFVDFFGDYQAVLSFTVREEDLDHFMTLSPELWKKPSDFQPTTSMSSVGGIEIPIGTFVIEEWSSSDYSCKYAVDPASRRVYFYRGSS